MDKAARNKIKGLLKEQEKTYKQCSKALGISENTLVNKLNGKSPFYIDELNTLGDYLGLTNGQKAEIFLR
jgi:transcriptional regulator with XRE-family HTH domain